MHSQQQPQPDPLPYPPPQTPSYPSSKRSRVSTEFREYVSRRRCLLSVIAAILVLVMCLGIVLAAHHYYVSFGGQGYLKARDQFATPEVAASNVYLPLRKVASFRDDVRWSTSSPLEVPYYACGDQQNSCEAYNQPDICCPVKMTCHPTPLTNSKIYCCNSTETKLECEGPWTTLPTCMPSYNACLAEEGGGCCPMNTQCTANGCITITGPTTVSGITSSAAPTTGPVTVTEIPAATATSVKQGEVAQSGVGTKESVVLKLCLPYSSVSFLVFVAALMGLL